mgnify:CR=1 FL=1
MTQQSCPPFLEGGDCSCSLKTLTGMFTNNEKLLNAYFPHFHIFSCCILLVFNFHLKDSEQQRSWKISYFRKAFPVLMSFHFPAALPLKWRSFIHPEKTDESCSIFWRLLGSFGRELCFRWAVLSPWVLFHHFPIVCPFMFLTAAAEEIYNVDHDLNHSGP